MHLKLHPPPGSNGKAAMPTCTKHAVNQQMFTVLLYAGSTFNLGIFEYLKLKWWYICYEEFVLIDLWWRVTIEHKWNFQVTI